MLTSSLHMLTELCKFAQAPGEDGSEGDCGDQGMLASARGLTSWLRLAAARYEATLARNPVFAELTPDDKSYFKGLLGEGGVIDDQTALDATNE